MLFYVVLSYNFQIICDLIRYHVICVFAVMFIYNLVYNMEFCILSLIEECFYLKYLHERLGHRYQ